MTRVFYAMAVRALLPLIIAACGSQSSELAESKRGGVSNKIEASGDRQVEAEPPSTTEQSTDRQSKDLFKTEAEAEGAGKNDGPLAEVFRKNAAPATAATVTVEGEGDFVVIAKRVQDDEWVNLSDEEPSICTDGALASVVFKGYEKNQTEADATKIDILKIRFEPKKPIRIELGTQTLIISCPDGILPWQF